MSSKDISGIPDSTDNHQNSFHGTVSLKVKPGNPFPLEGALSPLSADGGLVFPYTPTLQVGHAANYGTYDITHTIYQPQYYISTASPSISITANFTANDIQEAEHTAAAIQFLKTCTKMDYGRQRRGKGAGTPPPILNLRAYSRNALHAKATPVVIRSMNYTMPEDVNYVETANGIVPTMLLLAVELSVQISPATVRDRFNIDTFSKGNLLGGFN